MWWLPKRIAVIPVTHHTLQCLGRVGHVCFASAYGLLQLLLVLDSALALLNHRLRY